MGSGLLGALGGLGTAMTQIGRDIQSRREAALEAARKEAEYQRRRQDQKADQVEERQHDLTKLGVVEEGRAQRTAATNQVREKIAGQTLEVQRARIGVQEKAIKSRETIAAENRAAAKDLATLRSRLDSQNDAAALRLKKELDRDDTKGIAYGPPRQDGLAELLRVTKGGKVVPTGRWVDRLEDRDDDDDDDEDNPFG